MPREISLQDLATEKLYSIPGENGKVISESDLEKKPHALKYIIEALLADPGVSDEDKLKLRAFQNSHSRQMPPNLPGGE